jgi:hypothetical protein
MQKFGAMLGDILEDLTGKRQTERKETPFDAQCANIARFIALHEERLRQILMPAFEASPAHNVLTLPDTIDCITAALQDLVNEKLTGLSDAQTRIVLNSLQTATSVFWLIARCLRIQYPTPPTPATFRTKENVAVTASILLSQYPGNISINVAQMLVVQDVGLENDDICDTARAEIRTSIVQGIQNNPSHLSDTKKLGYCPAHQAIGPFATTLFHLQADAYETVFRKAVGDAKVLTDDALLDLRYDAAFERIIDLL